MKLATFDIFDTALIRKCGSPSAVFDLAARRLWPEDEGRRCEFVNLRMQQVRRHGRDATLADIYSAAGMAGFPEYGAEMLAKAEMETESGMLTVNPRVREQITRLRDEGWTVKFLSDMYLPAEFLEKVLRREGCLLDDEEVIVSCEWGARKDDGSLYRKVREKYAPEKWRHFGDNLRSDVRMARKNGVKGEQVIYPLTPVEKRLMATKGLQRKEWRLNLLTGLSRTVSLRHGYTPEAILAADYVAPLYVAYVAWLLRSARRKGLKRLHFLSRDGYIMMKIAEALDMQDMEFNYLFVSRKSLMRAYLKDNPAERYVEITDRRTLIGQRVESLLGRLQLNRRKLAEDYGITFSYDRIVNEAQQRDFLSRLFDNPDFSPRFHEVLSEDALLTEDYLRQEGLADGTPQAMVDIGWLGTTRLMIRAILGRDIPTYYVGVRSDVYDRRSGDFEAWFSRGILDTRATALIENYFSASPWPSTAGYTTGAAGEIRPRFAKGQEYTETEVVRTNVDVCCEMARELRPYLDEMDDDLLMRWASVSLEGIASLGDEVDLSPLLRSADFDGVPMARRLSLPQLATLVLTGARHTAFDRASLELTVGRRLGRPLWRVHEITGRIRERAYRLYLRLHH